MSFWFAVSTLEPDEPKKTGQLGCQLTCFLSKVFVYSR
jgi:hypothetical protein